MSRSSRTGIRLPRSLSATVAYRTDLGISLVGKSEEVLKQLADAGLRRQIQLVFTSPPFPLNRKKKYDNKQGDAFKNWLADYAGLLKELVTCDGSIVVEMGNAWEPGKPVMSTLAIEALLAFKTAANLHLCQEFIWHNPSKLPTPAQWVTVERIRVKDSFTRLWWMSPSENPKADNRSVLAPYSAAMERLLKTKKYNAGRRPSEHVIRDKSFLKNNGGAIPPSVIAAEQMDYPEAFLVGSNTHRLPEYAKYCEENDLQQHPARMPPELAAFFIKFCSESGDLVLDPFAGSNTTGATAESLGRRWLSIEANNDYARSGLGRFPPLVRANAV